MTAESEIRHGRHCVFNLHVHLVFVAKYRRHVFDGPAIERLREIFGAVCLPRLRGAPGGDGWRGRPRPLVGGVPAKGSRLRPREQPEGLSSRLLGRDRRDIAKRFWKGVLWSPSYFAASCGGAPIAIVRQYIKQQQRPD